jgi:PAB1-binding protein PBP1
MYSQNEEGQVIDDPNVEHGSTLILTEKQWFGLQARKLDLNGGETNELRIDGAIRGSDMTHLKGRELTQVASNWLEPSTHSSLEGDGSVGGGRGGAGNWDQFAANKKLDSYKPGSNFNLNLYTTPLDMSTHSKEQQDYATRIAKEIEGQVSDNPHLRQERGHVAEDEGGGDGDEEALWSGVIGTGGLKKTNKDRDSCEGGGVWKRGGGSLQKSFSEGSKRRQEWQW